MNDVFDLNEYKNYLMNYFIYPCRDESERLRINQFLLKCVYDDEKIENIIYETKKFLKRYLKEAIKNSWSICRVDIYDVECVFLTSDKGWPADIWISVDSFDESKKISLYLLKEYLGDKISIYMDDGIIQFKDNDLMIGEAYCTPQLVLYGEFLFFKEKLINLKDKNQMERKLTPFKK